jgi:hypothetical protein
VIVKLGDFGFAKAVADGHTHHSSGAGMGTFLTLPPQALHGKYDAPGDVYSWAKCMCWAVMDALRLPRTETELRTCFVVRSHILGIRMVGILKRDEGVG